MVSTFREKVYEAWKPRPPTDARRSSAIRALYQESPSLVFSSMAEKVRFWRGAPAGKTRVPSGSSPGRAVLASVLRSSFWPRAPA